MARFCRQRWEKLSKIVFVAEANLRQTLQNGKSSAVDLELDFQISESHAINPFRVIVVLGSRVVFQHRDEAVALSLRYFLEQFFREFHF